MSKSPLSTTQSEKIKLYPNPGLFYYVTEETMIVCDPLRQDEYEILPEYFERLKFWNGKNEDFLTSIDEELLEGNLILENKLEYYPWKGDKMSFLFHLSTRNHESMTPHQSEDELIEAFTSMSNAKGTLQERPISRHIHKTVVLPTPCLKTFEEASFFQVVKDRKTSRNFDGTTIPLEKLSNLLYLTFGHIHGKQWDELQELKINFSSERKSAPSGTGLQACEAYLAVCHVDTLEPGFYRYHPESHSIDLLTPGCDDEMISYLVCDQFWLKGAACGIFITVDMERKWHKTDFSRGYAYIFLEAGHISQTALLGATALGLKTWLTGSVRDAFVADKLQVDGHRSFPVTTVFIGNGSDDAVPAKIRELALKKLEG